MRQNRVEMKNRHNLIKNSVEGLNSSLDTAQERVSELEDGGDKSPRTLHREINSWKTGQQLRHMKNGMNAKV